MSGPTTPCAWCNKATPLGFRTDSGPYDDLGEICPACHLERYGKTP